MISALLFVFLLQALIHIINTAGKQTVNDVLWSVFTKLPGAPTGSEKDLTPLRREVARLQRELAATSAQDEFAKWAKLRRQHDKAKEQYESQASAQQSSRANFDRIASALRWLGTQGLQFVCNFYLGREAMFWLPRGWVPHPAEWLLSFPRAPLGSVSVTVWASACACVLGLATEAAVGVWALRDGRVKVGPNRGEKIAMEVPSGGREKKEL